MNEEEIPDAHEESPDSPEEESAKDEKLAGKFLSERSKQIGRDGAYLEVTCQDSVASVEDIIAARMIVLTAMRLELTEPSHVLALKGILGKVAAGEFDDDLGEMDLDQKGFYVFRKIFEIGLLEMAKACGVEVS